MTEPQAGADPKMFTTRAVKDGDEWVINGWKFFSSNARTSSFLIVMAVTDPDVSAYQGMSMFLVPTDAPGVERKHLASFTERGTTVGFLKYASGAQHEVREQRRRDGSGVENATLVIDLRVHEALLLVGVLRLSRQTGQESRQQTQA